MQQLWHVPELKRRFSSLALSLLFKHEEDRAYYHEKGNGVVPSKLLLEIEKGKTGEDNKGDDFLDDLELSRGKAQMARSVGWHLETILDKGYEPADYYYFPQGRMLVFQVSVPGDRHEYV
jgi:hypothetical protein